MPFTRNTKSSFGPVKSRSRAALALAVTVSVSSPGIALVLTLLSMSAPVQAADFSRAKRIIVPASAIQRHGDIDTYNGSDTSYSSYGGSSYASPYQTSPSTGSSDYSVSRSSKSGLVPPPPPMAPSLLSPSLVTPTLSSSFQPNSSNSGYSEAMSGGGRPVKQVNADPPKKSLERHESKSRENKAHSEKSSASHTISHANKLMQDGKLEEAHELLERYHKSYPQNAEIKSKLSDANLMQAKYFLRQDNYMEGANHARQALFYKSGNVEAKSVLAQALKHQGVNDLDVNHRLAQAHLLLSQGKLNEAHAEYTQANAIQPNVDSHIGLGNVALRSGNMEEAHTHYTSALEKNPNSAAAHRQMGALKYLQKDLVSANSSLSKALILDSKDDHAAKMLTDLWQRQVSARPNEANSHLGLARAYQLSGDLKSAQSEYKTVVKIDPSHPNLPAARESFKWAMAHQEADTALQAAKTLESNGALLDAYQKASQAAAISPGSKFKLYQASLAERLGYRSHAKDLYMMALQEDPKNIDAARRISELNSSMSTDPGTTPLIATAGALPGVPHTDLPGSPPTAPSNGFQSMSNIPPSAPFSVQKAPEGPALPYLPGPYSAGTGAGTGTGTPAYPGNPGPSADHLQNMTGFLSSLRNHMVSHEKEMKKYEDKVMVDIGKESPRSSSSDADGEDIGGGIKLPKLPDLSSDKISELDTKKLIGSDDIAKMLGKTPSVSVADKEVSSAIAEGAEPRVGDSSLASGLSGLSGLTKDGDSSLSSGLSGLNDGVSGAESKPAPSHWSTPWSRSSKPSGLRTDSDSGSTGGIRGEEGITKTAIPLASASDSAPATAPSIVIDGNTIAALKSQIASNPALGQFANQASAMINSGKPIDLSGAPQAIQKQLSKMSTADMDRIYNSIKQPLASKLGMKTAPAPAPAKVVAKAKPAVAPSRGKKVTPSTAKNIAKKSPPVDPLLGQNSVSRAPFSASSSRVGSQAGSGLPSLTVPQMSTGSSSGLLSAMSGASPNSVPVSQYLASKNAPEAASSAVAASEGGALASAGSLPMSGAVPNQVGSIPGMNQYAGAYQTPMMTPQTASTGMYPNGNDIPALKPPIGTPSVPHFDGQPKLRSYMAPPTGGAPRMDLTGISVKGRNVRLNVVLHNTTGSNMVIPPSARALMRKAGAPDLPVKFKFAKDQLGAGEQVTGYITIPGQKVDPTADVVIPKLVASEAGAQDVHLTVPVSALQEFLR